MTEIQEVAQSIRDNTIRNYTVDKVFSRGNNVVVIYYAWWGGSDEVQVSGNAAAIAEELNQMLA